MPCAKRQGWRLIIWLVGGHLIAGGYIQSMRRATISILLLLAQGCLNPFDFERDILLGVSDVAVPEVASPQGNFTVTLTVVTGGCKSFEGIRGSATSAVLTLEAWGTDAAGPGRACTSDIRFEPRPYLAEGPFTNPFTVRVKQPDGSSITRTVRIE